MLPDAADRFHPPLNHLQALSDDRLRLAADAGGWLPTLVASWRSRRCGMIFWCRWPLPADASCWYAMLAAL
jgi:hypothetical protein